MSLLSSTQGTPDRVWSLVRLTAALGGELPRANADGWINPGFRRGETLVQDKPEAVGQVVNAAVSLGALVSDAGMLRLTLGCPGDDEGAFRDWAHDRLASLDSAEKDAVILETYAWIAAQSVREGSLLWTHTWTREAFVDAADKALPEGSDDDGPVRVNTTKLPALRRWLEYLGLMTALPIANSPPQPSAAPRLARELARAGLATAGRLSAREFLDKVKSRMPYLDGGRMFDQTAKRNGIAVNPLQASPLLTEALHDLEDAGLISMQVLGDGGGVIRLDPGATHKISSFKFVDLHEGLGQ
jgi:hypothetical protein